MNVPPDFLAAALAYADIGLPVFPCDPSKRPLTEHGFTDASRDPAMIAGWWKRWPVAMIGMPTGEPSGIWALDVDDLELFAASAPDLPLTRKVTTGKGFHLHWRRDPETLVRNA